MAPFIDIEFVLTACVAFAAAGGSGWLIWFEKQPKPVGQPSLIPTTPVLFLCLLVIILALAHLVSLVTGTPHVGRFGMI